MRAVGIETPLGTVDPRAVALAVLGIVHVNANCSELGRSLVLYRDLVGLAPAVHTQPGAGFGLAG